MQKLSDKYLFQNKKPYKSTIFWGDTTSEKYKKIIKQSLRKKKLNKLISESLDIK